MILTASAVQNSVPKGERVWPNS